MSYSENNFYPDGKFLGTFYYNEPGGYLIRKNVNIFTDGMLTRREIYSGGESGVTATISYAEEYEKGTEGEFKYKETREYSDGINISKKTRSCSSLSGELCHMEIYENGTDLTYTVNYQKEICPTTGNICCKQVKVYPDDEEEEGGPK